MKKSLASASIRTVTRADRAATGADARCVSAQVMYAAPASTDNGITSIAVPLLRSMTTDLYAKLCKSCGKTLPSMDIAA